MGGVPERCQVYEVVTFLYLEVGAPLPCGPPLPLRGMVRWSLKRTGARKSGAKRFCPASLTPQDETRSSPKASLSTSGQLRAAPGVSSKAPLLVSCPPSPQQGLRQLEPPQHQLLNFSGIGRGDGLGVTCCATSAQYTELGHCVGAASTG